MNKKFWENKRVIVTGANGFIGSNLVLELVNKKSKVFALIKDVEIKNPIFELVKKNISKVIIGNINDYELISKIFLKNNIDFCFHLASIASSKDSQSIIKKNPPEEFKTNIMGSINLLEASRLSKNFKGFILASTIQVYKNNENLPFKEDYPLQATLPYESSKICAEILTKTYSYAHGLPVAIARFTNTYGQGDLNFSRLVPSVMKNVMNNKNPIINNANAIRDFLYIKDAISAYITLAENINKKDVNGEIFNFGSNSKIKVGEVAKRIIQLNKNKNLKANYLKNNKIEKRYPSIKKAQKIIKWNPKYSIEEGLRETYSWYKNFILNG